MRPREAAKKQKATFVYGDFNDTLDNLFDRHFDILFNHLFAELSLGEGHEHLKTQKETTKKEGRRLVSV